MTLVRIVVPMLQLNSFERLKNAVKPREYAVTDLADDRHVTAPA